MEYVLHYAPDNASLIIRLALEEMGLPYRTQLVDRSRNAQHSDDYLRLNPSGRIPVLETPDGVMFETAAILLWLTERHPGFAPPVTSPERGWFLTWLMAISNDVQTLFRLQFYPDRYVGSDRDVQDKLRTGMQAAIRESLGRLAEQLTHQGTLYFGGDTPCVTDLYLGPFLRWAVLYPAGGARWFDLETHPALHALARALEDRPSVRAASLAEGLGPTPFSKPQPANPPEGSAT